MMQRPLLVTVWMLSLADNVQSQWVQSGTVANVVLGMSPDGSTIIVYNGINTIVKNVWTPTQSLLFLGSTIFLSYDGSIFASSYNTGTQSFLSPNVGIFSSTTSPGTWKVISTIYGYSLGLDSDATLTIAAATSDWKTLALVSSKCYSNATITLCDRSIFILQSNNVGSNYNLVQQLTGFPNDYNLQYNRILMSADGSILATLWSSGYCYTDPSQQTPAYVAMYSRGSDGMYAISTQNFGDHPYWRDFAISSNGQILTAAVCDTQSSRIQFYLLVNGQYQSISILWSGPFSPGTGQILSTSSDSSVIFVSVSSNINILKQLNQTSWFQVQSISESTALIFSSADGSTFVSSGASTVVYSGPPSQVSATPSASPTASTLITATPTPTATSTSTGNSPASISASTLPQPATITISVLSTALTLIIVALFVKWFSTYRKKAIFRADGSERRSEPVLWVNSKT
jgi:hypothetical protein